MKSGMDTLPPYRDGCPTTLLLYVGDYILKKRVHRVLGGISSFLWNTILGRRLSLKRSY